MVDATRRTMIKGLGGLAAGALPLAANPARARGKQLTVMTDWSPHGMHAGLFLAVQKNWFKDAGVDVKVLDGKGSAATVQQAASGQIDVGFAQVSTLPVARHSGIDLISIACWVRAGDNGVMVPVGKGIKGMKDLKGQKVAYAAASTTGPFLDAFLKDSGVTRSDFHIINVDAGSLISIYTSGAADAVMSTVAFFLPIVQKIRPSKGIMWADFGLRLPSYGFVVKPSMMDARDADLRRLVSVQVKTWEYIFAGHEDEAVDAILAQRQGQRLDRNVLKGQLVGYMKLFSTPATKGKKPGWQAEADWAAALKAMTDAGVIKPGAKPTDFYTNRYIT